MRMKKIIVGIICLNLCLTAAGCGSQKDNSSKAESPSATEAVTEAENSSEPDRTEAPEAPTEADGAQKETTFWKGSIPDTLQENEDYTSENDTYSSHTFEARDSNDYVEHSVEIIVNTEDSLDYRQNLVSHGIDLRDYADDKLEKVELNGCAFLKVEYEYWGEPVTLLAYRNEGAQMSVNISVSGDYGSEDVQSLINSLTFTLPEGSETDAPYPWDGAPIVAETGTVEVDSYSLTATQLIASESILPNDIFDNRVVVTGDTMYVLSDYHLYIFTLNGSDAALQETIDLEEDYDHMSADDSGNVYISAFMSPILVYRDGKQTDAPEIENEFAVSPDGSFGVEFFTSADDVSKITIQKDGSVKKEALSIQSDLIDLISDVFVTEDYIVISGSASDDTGHKVFVLDHNGAYIKTLSGPDGNSLGSITGAIQTKNGILAIDGNLRNITLWDNDGNYLGTADDGQLFGTDYPWISGLYQAPDGKIYVSMVEERPDQSWDELILFQLDTDF